MEKIGNKFRKIQVLYQKAQNEECNSFMMFSNPFEKLKVDTLLELPEMTSEVHFGDNFTKIP